MRHGTGVHCYTPAVLKVFGGVTEGRVFLAGPPDSSGARYALHGVNLGTLWPLGNGLFSGIVYLQS